VLFVEHGAVPALPKARRFAARGRPRDAHGVAGFAGIGGGARVLRASRVRNLASRGAIRRYGRPVSEARLLAEETAFTEMIAGA